MTILRLISSSAAAALLAGCVSLLPETEPPSPRYALTAPTPTLEGAAVKAGVAVDRPTALAALDTASIAVVRGGHRIAYRSGLEWSDRAPRLIETMIVRTLENAELFPNAGRRGDAAGAAYRLTTDIRHFEEVDDEGRAAYVSLRVALHDARSGMVAGARVIDEREPFTGGPDDLVAAFDRANDRAMTRIAKFVQETAG